MAALILPSRRVVQPQGPVEVDWGNPLAQGLVFALNPASGERNLATPKQAVTLSPLVLSNSTTGRLVGTGAAEYEVTADLTKNLTLFAVWRSREASGYLAADSARAVFSSRTAGNQGWTWGRPTGANAIGGGATGNLTRQGFTLNGIADYQESNTTIESLVDSPVAVRYVRSTGVISWFNKGLKSSPDTTASTAGSNGGNLVYRRQGPYASNLQPFLDRTGASFVWNRALPDAEIAQVSENPWQLFRPIQRRIWVPVAGGGGISQTVAFTLEDVSAAVSQNLSHAQSLTGTLDGVTVSISQTAQHSQALSATLDDIAFAASQTVGNATNQTLAVVLDDVTVAAAQTLSHSQALDATLDGVTVAASQTLSHSQALAATLDGVTVAINQSAAPSSKEQSLAVVLDGIQVAIAQEGPASLIDTHDGFWAKEWARIRAREKRKYQEEIQERVEEIQDEIAEVEQQIVEVKQAPKPKKATPARDFYAEQARIVEHLIARRNQLIDEEDEELLLLL